MNLIIGADKRAPLSLPLSANCPLLKENCLADEISQVHQYASVGLEIPCRLIWPN